MIRRTVLISLIGLCILTIVAWARSRRSYDRITLLTVGDTYWTLSSFSNGLDVSITTHFNSHPLSWNPVSSTPMPTGWAYSCGPQPAFVDESFMDDNAIVSLKAIASGTKGTSELSFAGCRLELFAEPIAYGSAPPITRRYVRVGIPFWLIVILCLLPIIWLQLRPAMRRRRRLRANRCIACGYDLRGSTERCPECGTQRHAGASVA